MDSNKAARTATALLTVLCFLNIWEVHEVLITAGIGHVSITNFPETISGYFISLKHLLASGQVTIERRPEKIIRVTDTLATTIIGASNMSEFTAAFNKLLQQREDPSGPNGID